MSTSIEWLKPLSIGDPGHFDGFVHHHQTARTKFFFKKPVTFITNLLAKFGRIDEPLWQGFFQKTFIFFPILVIHINESFLNYRRRRLKILATQQETFKPIQHCCCCCCCCYIYSYLCIGLFFPGFWHALSPPVDLASIQDGRERDDECQLCGRLPTQKKNPGRMAKSSIGCIYTIIIFDFLSLKALISWTDPKTNDGHLVWCWSLNQRNLVQLVLLLLVCEGETPEAKLSLTKVVVRTAAAAAPFVKIKKRLDAISSRDGEQRGRP